MSGDLGGRYKWIFSPDEYGGMDEIFPASFMHPFDHFNPGDSFPFAHYEFPNAQWPLASKGVEIDEKDPNPNSITRACAQLSYAMADKIISASEHQISNDAYLSKFTYFHIPIIITTAKLYRIKEKLGIAEIKKSSSLSDVSEEVGIVSLKRAKSAHLMKYNRMQFENFLTPENAARIKGMLNAKFPNSIGKGGFHEDPAFLFSVIAEHYCPTSFVIIHYDGTDKNLRRFMNFIDPIFKEDASLLAELSAYYIDREKRYSEFMQKFKLKPR